jgi:hypothetical protein
MKKTLIGISVLVVLGLLIIAGCSPIKTATSGNTPVTGATGTDQAATPDGYVNDQIVDENATVDVGQLI